MGLLMLISYLNAFYTSGLFHFFMLADIICHSRGVGTILSLLIYF